MPRIQILAHCRNMRAFRTAAASRPDDGIAGKCHAGKSTSQLALLLSEKFHISKLIISSLLFYALSQFQGDDKVRRGIYETISWSKNDRQKVLHDVYVKL